MQLLITFSHRRAAQAFVDYMATHGVHIETKVNNDKIELWLADEAKLNFTLQELDRFLANPMDRRYSEASWHTGSTQTSIEYQSQNYWHTLREKAGWLTLSVMALCAFVYVLMLVLGTQQIMAWLAFPAGNYQYGEIWRWLTPAFIHFSITHISFNLILWWYIGGPVEQRLGTAKLLQILLISAIASNYIESLFIDNNFGGLSGVVYALVGYAWLMGERAPERGIRLDRSLMIVSVLWLFVGYFDILGISIANAAHLSGLAVGLLLAFWDTRKPVNNRY